MNNKIPLLVIVGPTASGKTALSVQLAKALDGEIISADSMQVYKGMSVATAVPTLKEREGVPHWLMECIEPTQPFAVADYVAMAHNTVKEVYSRNKLPILVGGTGLYVDSLVSNIQFSEQSDDSALRQELYARAETLGLEEMHRQLANIDPASAERIHKNDKKRILRALEIYYSTGQTKSDADFQSKTAESPYQPLYIGLGYKNRDVLYDRINCRVDIMVQEGLLQEAKAVYAQASGLSTAAQAIGHKELFHYFAGECPREEALELLKRKTRQYAKRQLTWFTKNPNIHWIYMDETNDPVGQAIQIINQHKWR